MNRKWLVTIGIVSAAACLNAQENDKITLATGMKAPAIQAGEWIQGDAVRSFETGKVYVVEFWATWCPPCRASIPHLNELHMKFKDQGLVVIGQNVWERKPAAEITKFVKEEMGDKMTYRVALDNNNKMATSWMTAAGQDGIPAAFVIDKTGKIAWIGHPMSGMDEVVEKLLKDQFDSQKESARQKIENERAETIRGFSSKLGAAVMAERWDEALGVLQEMRAALPAEAAQAMDFMKFNILLRKGDEVQVHELARELSGNTDEAQLLNALAWEIATSKYVKNRDLSLAISIAEKANRLTEEKDSAILDTLARITFMRGAKADAITLQNKAIASTDDEDLKSALKETLASYEKGELPDIED